MPRTPKRRLYAHPAPSSLSPLSRLPGWTAATWCLVRPRRPAARRPGRPPCPCVPLRPANDLGPPAPGAKQAACWRAWTWCTRSRRWAAPVASPPSRQEPAKSGEGEGVRLVLCIAACGSGAGRCILVAAGHSSLGPCTAASRLHSALSRGHLQTPACDARTRLRRSRLSRAAS